MSSLKDVAELPTATARSERPTSRQQTVHLHIRMRREDADQLRHVALERDQTLAATVRYLLKSFLVARSANRQQKSESRHT